MQPSTAEIWTRIQAVAFDGSGAVFPMSERLARDNGWSLDYAARVFEEYKRFACLAATGVREVTPSDQVDQAWHLHLLYTRHYWGEWCTALGYQLHHGPTKGGSAEGVRYLENYEASLALYAETFGHAPPSDIWPDAKERFRDPSRFVRLDTSKHLILNKPWA